MAASPGAGHFRNRKGAILGPRGGANWSAVCNLSPAQASQGNRSARARQPHPHREGQLVARRVVPGFAFLVIVLTANAALAAWNVARLPRLAPNATVSEEAVAQLADCT